MPIPFRSWPARWQLTLTSAALSTLEQYPWPGNVRELEHAIYRAAIVACATQNHTELELLPTHFNLNVELMAERINDGPYEPVLATDLATMTQQFQRDVIQKTLEDCDRNWAATARKLSLDSGNLHRLAKRLGIK
ncbi:hypothetical protein [Serratia silvae]|uniref:Sigma-54 factor interaction domain-containing protein n=1 Tax=Serratia silvae TaxID=2824122 RepID=A0ABT0KIA0_9GAMM|nr:hypothetical protein [Serratia silvae]MCL1031765.1 hypothetical protein [Serratia silvae]